MIADLRSRIATVFFGFCIGHVIIISNLLLLQVKNAHFFSRLGSQQYRETVVKLPPRAPIVDRSGRHYLAMNKDCISAFITPNKLNKPEALAAFLEEHFPEAAERLQTHRQKKFLYIARRLTPAEVTLIEEHAISDIQFVSESSRFYPAASTAPLIGLTDIENQGTMGVERSLNAHLAGTPTTYLLEKDARSGRFYFTRETTSSGKASEPLQLTIDADLQFLVAQELQLSLDKFNAKSASAVVMDPDNGEVLAMVTVPTFDPNNTRTLPIELTRNGPISEAYELGSVMKVFAALAALEEGVVTNNEIIDCQDTKTALVNGRTVNTWHAHGLIPFSDVIAYSNNIGIALVASRLGHTLHTHYARLGFGSKSGITLPGEQGGFLNPPENWSAHSIISLSYGYEVSATLTQLARAFSIIANGGYPVTPTILYDPNNRQRPTKNDPLYRPETIAQIKEILEHTATKGTARAAQLDGYRIMCKTGTANLLENGTYTPNKNVYTCAGIVERGEYKRVVVASVREGTGKNMYASTVAAPLLKRIVRKMLIHEHIV